MLDPSTILTKPVLAARPNGVQRGISSTVKYIFGIAYVPAWLYSSMDSDSAVKDFLFLGACPNKKSLIHKWQAPLK